MTFVIGEACIGVQDRACVDECPVDCIREGPDKLYINPIDCIDCGNCQPVCPVSAIFPDRAPKPGEEHHIQANADFFADPDDH
ncbi:indolepyruvate ferredoxin oxidoreductase subunit alpha [Aeromicrobium sp. CTD01-1L150]|uniref:indolepyruvate ferredoxin oxidoreductase subunit alpha n=1 Tax=Aeromicrobium sp. CTD01-1L150 TaxID=3341830 RepID=UPI0035C0FADA